MALRINANSRFIEITRVDGTTDLIVFEGNIGCNAWKDDDTIKEIEIFEGVGTIEDGAFENCKNLTKVTLPESVKLIRGSAFAGCTALGEVVVPRTLESVNCRLSQAVKTTSFELTAHDLTRGSEISLLYEGDFDPNYWD